jgi:hypothetical protein
MSIISILIIVLSGLNDLIDLTVAAVFPGINEMITFMFSTMIAMLVFLDLLQKKLSGDKDIWKVLFKRLLTLVGADVLESIPFVNLLPFQTGGAVIMGMIRTKTAPPK